MSDMTDKQMIEALRYDLQAAERRAATAYADALADIIHICEFAANGTVEEMSQDGHSETWKIIAENSVEQYRSIVKLIQSLQPATSRLKWEIATLETRHAECIHLHLMTPDDCCDEKKCVIGQRIADLESQKAKLQAELKKMEEPNG